MYSRIALAALLGLCIFGCRGPEAAADHPPPYYVYLVNCDSTVARVNLAGREAPNVVTLSARTTAWLIPPASGGPCSVSSPRYDERNRRLFVVSPQEAEGKLRHWRVLGFRLPDMAFTDAIELDPVLVEPPAILVPATGDRLLVSQVTAPDEGQIVEYNVAVPRGARLLEDRRDDVWFSDNAYLGPDAETIYDGADRIHADGNQDECSLDNFIGVPEGASLDAFVTRAGGKKTVPAEFAASAAARVLFRVRAKSGAWVPVVVDTPSDRITVFSSAPRAGLRNLHLTPDGARVLVEEVASVDAPMTEKTGRAAMFDAESGAPAGTWKIPDIAGAASRLVCISPRGELLYGTQGRLLIFDTVAGRTEKRDPGIAIDANTRCIFANP
jgi:hypothetical protein